MGKVFPKIEVQSTTANGRSNPSPLVAHVPIALSQDRDSVMVAGHKMFDMVLEASFLC